MASLANTKSPDFCFNEAQLVEEKKLTLQSTWFFGKDLIVWGWCYVLEGNEFTNLLSTNQNRSSEVIIFFLPCDNFFPS